MIIYLKAMIPGHIGKPGTDDLRYWQWKNAWQGPFPLFSIIKMDEIPSWPTIINPYTVDSYKEDLWARSELFDRIR